MSKLQRWLEENKLAMPDELDVESLKAELVGHKWPHDRLCMCDKCSKTFRDFALHLLILLDGNENNEQYQKKPFRLDTDETDIAERGSVQGLRKDSLRGVRELRRGGDRRRVPRTRDRGSGDEAPPEDS